LPSPSPQVLIDPSLGPLGLQTLDSRVIRWHIPKDGICVVKFFGGISFGLVMVLEFDIRVHRYYYVENDLQAWQASMHHMMMLSQQHLEFLLASVIQGYQRTLLRNIILLGA
jgi:hypothetical protein